MLFFVVFDLVLSCGVIVVCPIVVIIFKMILLIPFPFGWLLNKKAARVEVNIWLAFL